ncbi:transposase, partial [Helicobacter pylori]
MGGEDLQVKNMTKRAKLKNVKQKSGLNQSINN